MCSADRAKNLSLPTKNAPCCYAGLKRPHALTLALYDPAAAEQRANAASLSANAGALVPFLAPPVIDAVSLSAAAPSKAAERAEPWWLRKQLFPDLNLRFDLPVHFIDEKPVTATDLDPHQNRFRLPNSGVMRNLCPILSDEELEAASIQREETPKPRPQRPPPTQEELQGRKKRMGKKHGGLPVLVINLNAGIQELQLTRWESSGVIVIKGERYREYITRCSFKAEDDDVVEIWAFKDRTFHYFGVDLCQETPLYVLLTKKERQPAA